MKIEAARGRALLILGSGRKVAESRVPLGFFGKHDPGVFGRIVPVREHPDRERCDVVGIGIYLDPFAQLENAADALVGRLIGVEFTGPGAVSGKTQSAKDGRGGVKLIKVAGDKSGLDGRGGLARGGLRRGRFGRVGQRRYCAVVGDGYGSNGRFGLLRARGERKDHKQRGKQNRKFFHIKTPRYLIETQDRGRGPAQII